MTPYGQAGTQYPQPLQTSGWTTTVPNSVRNRAPVGHTSRHAACVQCLHTSEDISQRTPLSPDGAPWSSWPGKPGGPIPGRPRSVVVTAEEAFADFSMNATCRQVSAPSAWLLS